MAKKLANKFSPIIIVILIAVFLYFILRACNVYEGATNMETGFEVEESDGSNKKIIADSTKFKTFLQDSNIFPNPTIFDCIYAFGFSIECLTPA